MKKLLLASLLLAPLVSLANMAEEVGISEAFLRETLTDVHTTAGYCNISNTGNNDVVLTGISAPNMQKGELHTIRVEQGVAKMFQIDQIDIAPNTTVKLEPGSYHLMLFMVDANLQPPTVLPITFQFKDGSTKVVEMSVKNMNAPWDESTAQVPAQTHDH